MKNLTKNEDLTFFNLICPLSRTASIILNVTLEVFQRIGAISANEILGNAEHFQNAVVNNHYVAALGSISRCESFL